MPSFGARANGYSVLAAPPTCDFSSSTSTFRPVAGQQHGGDQAVVAGAEEDHVDGAGHVVENRTTMANLLRVLGLGFGLAVTIGNTVGAGHPAGPRRGGRAQLPNAWAILGVWLAGGLYALLGALSLSELGAMIPRSGGYYVFARQALGEFPGVRGRLDRLAGHRAGRIAAASILVAEYAVDLYPPLAGRQLVAGAGDGRGAGAGAGPGHPLGGGGTGRGQRRQGVGAAGAGGGVLPAGAGAGGADHRPARRAVAPPWPSALLLALQAVIYTYDGWYGVIYFGEEVRQPGRATCPDR